MLTKTVRSRFNHEVGDKVEGCTIVEKHVVAPPNPAEQRRGIYDYVVEVAPAPAKEARKRTAPTRASSNGSSSRQSTPQEGFTRATPDEMGSVIRRLPSR
jgi:anti-sigma factor ChrR (cupin superfamily)